MCLTRGGNDIFAKCVFLSLSFTLFLCTCTFTTSPPIAPLSLLLLSMPFTKMHYINKYVFSDITVISGVSNVCNMCSMYLCIYLLYCILWACSPMLRTSTLEVRTWGREHMKFECTYKLVFSHSYETERIFEYLSCTEKSYIIYNMISDRTRYE